MCHHASVSCTTGVNAKLYCGGGDDVDHSSVRASHGSPLVSRNSSRRMKLTISWMMKQAMPSAIRNAPNAATVPPVVTVARAVSAKKPRLPNKEI